jgi:hypothetical protein
MLTLDQSTLFYWTLSDSNIKKRKYGRAINNWASAIPSNAKPVSHAASQVSRAPSQMARKPSSSRPDLPLPSPVVLVVRLHPLSLPTTPGLSVT